MMTAPPRTDTAAYVRGIILRLFFFHQDAFWPVFGPPARFQGIQLM